MVSALVQPQALAGGARPRVSLPADALALVGADLARCARRLPRLLDVDVEAIPAIGGYLVGAGGKRVRPVLTALGARAAGLGGDVSGLMCVGELIHLGSLLHDDVVDQGAERRGRPAPWRVFGNAAAVLAGDYCLARAVLLASEEGGHGVVDALAAAVTEMAEGEVLQLGRAGRLEGDRELYLDVVNRKSAALIAWCCAAGAHVLCDPEAVDALERYGRGVGVAFQVADDVLDYAAHPELTGKPPGADLRERKLTLPLIIAIERMPSLARRLAEPPSEEDLPELLGLVRESGALELALGEARRHAARGLAALESLPASRHRDALVSMGRFLVERGW